MTRFDLLRRALSVVLVAVALIVVPAVANATFTGTRNATLTVGTDRMETPTGVSGTWRCVPGFTQEGFSFTTTGFNDASPTGTTYKYSISRGANVVRTQTSSSKAVTVTTPNLPVDVGATQWTITIQTQLGNWTGTPYTKTITCGFLSNASGSL
jgi:hypothetical protein